MARAKKTTTTTIPLWMVTYSDLMVLLLTFFVLLLSMSQIDDRRVRNYLVAAQGESLIGEGVFSPLSKKDTKSSSQPGPMDAGELEGLREFIWENKDEDLNLETNRYIAIISIAEDTLFQPGSDIISEAGRSTLDSLAPQIQNLGYPMLVAGHTSTARDETANEYLDTRTMLDGGAISPTWKLSIDRALAVYEYLKAKNLDGVEMMNEAFGEYRPKVSNNTPFGRKLNRRVDLVLDRREQNGFAKTKPEEEEKDTGVYKIKDFQFQLDMTPTPQPKDSGASTNGEPG